jgi:hypothetical protein
MFHLAQISQIWVVSVLIGVALLVGIAHAEYHSVLFRLAMFGV